jgi:ferrous iron transport protein A
MRLWKGRGFVEHEGSECDRSGHRGWGLRLDQANPGCRFRVAKISGGRHLCARMAAMGIYPGSELELLCAGCDSPCVVRVKGGTLSLGKGISENILVVPTASADD